MNAAGKDTVVHFVANVGGGVWSVVKALAAQHRPRWRVLLVAVHKGPLRPAFAAEIKQYFDDAYLVSRPTLKGVYYLAPVSVAAALQALGVDTRLGNVVYHFHTGPFTPWIYRLPHPPQSGKWLACFHGSRGNFGDLHNPLKRWLNVVGVRRLLKRRFTLVAVSQRSAADCARMYGCREDDFRIAYNGTAVPHGRPRDSNAGPHRPFHVGFLGTVMPSKGWQKVVAAVQQVRRDGLDVVCSVAGDGPDSPKLQRLAAEYTPWLNAPGHVRSPEENFLPSLDALVLPSEFEGHPEVLLEALSCGVPCICSNVGGCAETVRHDQEGYILQENSPREIAACISRMAATEELWTRLSANCVLRHREMFTTERMAACWEALYLETAGRRPAADAPAFAAGGSGTEPWAPRSTMTG
jgi:glycosyltransferase involved in cell wall biosynthesis